MIPNNLKELTLCRLREFMREPTACVFVIIMPLLWISVLGLIKSDNDNEKFFIGLNKNSSSLVYYKKIRNSLSQNKNITFEEQSLKSLEKKLKNGTLSLIIDVKKDVAAYIYNPNDQSSYYSKIIIDKILQKEFGQKAVLKTQDKIINIKGNRYIDFLVPGLLALSLLTTSLFGTGMTIVLHRKQQLLKRYMITPMPIQNYIISHLLGRYAIMIIECIFILLFAYLFFDVHIHGPITAFLCVCTLGTLTFTSVSLLCSARLKNTGSYNGIINLLITPMMLLSGVWFSRHHFPLWCQKITEYLPLTALVDALRKISQQGLTITDVSSECLILCAYLIPSFFLTKKFFKWC